MIAVQVCIVTIAYMFGHDIIAIAYLEISSSIYFM